jgi:hypothetical protein
MKTIVSSGLDMQTKINTIKSRASSSREKHQTISRGVGNGTLLHFCGFKSFEGEFQIETQYKSCSMELVHTDEDFQSYIYITAKNTKPNKDFVSILEAKEIEIILEGNAYC